MRPATHTGSITNAGLSRNQEFWSPRNHPSLRAWANPKALCSRPVNHRRAHQNRHSPADEAPDASLPESHPVNQVTYHLHRMAGQCEPRRACLEDDFQFFSQLDEFTCWNTKRQQLVPGAIQ